MENLERNLTVPNTEENAHKSVVLIVLDIMNAWPFGWNILLEKGAMNK